MHCVIISQFIYTNIVEHLGFFPSFFFFFLLLWMLLLWIFLYGFPRAYVPFPLVYIYLMARPCDMHVFNFFHKGKLFSQVVVTIYTPPAMYEFLFFHILANTWTWFGHTLKLLPTCGMWNVISHFHFFMLFWDKKFFLLLVFFLHSSCF